MILLNARMKRVRGRRNFQADLDIQRERLREAIQAFVRLGRVRADVNPHPTTDSYEYRAGFRISGETIKFGAGRDYFREKIVEGVRGMSDEIAHQILDSFHHGKGMNP